MHSRIKNIIVSATALGALAASTTVSGTEFGYLGDIGPENWDELDPTWTACGSGEIQSPVNLRPQRTFPKIDVAYSSSTGRIFNNGHTVEIEIDSGSNVLTLDGVPYQLSQFHFHTGSEHRVNGRGYDMEMHLVHKSAAGTNAVVGVFLKRGASSNALAPVLAELPGVEVENEKYEIDEPFNPADFLPKSTANFRYMGSLTTPPCTEGVHWVVMTEPVTVSDEDIAQFAEQVRFNARFTQREIPARPGKP